MDRADFCCSRSRTARAGTSARSRAVSRGWPSRPRGTCSPATTRRMTMGGVEFVPEPQPLDERGHRGPHDGTSRVVGHPQTDIRSMTSPSARSRRGTSIRTAGASTWPSLPPPTISTCTPAATAWDGGLGTSWYADPSRNTTGLLLTSRSWTEPSPPPLFREFWRAFEPLTEDPVERWCVTTLLTSTARFLHVQSLTLPCVSRGPDARVAACERASARSKALDPQLG